MKKFISFLVAVMLVFFETDTDISAYTAENPDFPELSYNENISYSDYYDLYCNSPRPDSEITVNAFDYKSAEGFRTDFYKDRKAVISENSEACISYDINIPESGIYCIEINYCPLISNSPDIEFSLSIDNEIPYDTASRLILNRVWTNQNDIQTDSKGNQIRPFQVQEEIWCRSFLNDTDGLFSEPLVFYLEKGIHEICFDFSRASVAIENFRLCQPEKLKSHDDYLESLNVNKSDTSDNKIRIEGEEALYKSSAVLCPTYDNSGYLVSPSDPDNLLYNTIGDESWNKSFQSITWLIPREKIKTGFYRIGIKSRQDEMRGFCSARRIYIDGEIPFEELGNIRFYYDSDWNLICPEGYVYLDSERDHFITIEAIPDEISEYLRKLDNIISQLNDYYKNIIMITGIQPDRYTDYYVHEKLPKLTEDFQRLSAELKDIQTGIEEISESYGTEASAITGMIKILDRCVDKPLKIPQYLSEIHDNISLLSAWERKCTATPLEIDYIELCTENQNFSDIDERFMKSALFGLKSFIGSFFADYSSVSDIYGDDCIEVWINSGREQAQIIRELAESEFMTENPDIPVSVSLVSGGISEASMTGNQPDVALFIGGEFPVNLASRGLLVNIEEFEDYPQVKKRFHKNASVNYEYNNGCYGLPVSQHWAMMFYRKDILESLGLDSPPESWQELINMLPAIQRNYMSVGLVLAGNNISPATETGHTFACMVLQQGSSYYNSDLNKSMLDSPECVSAFEQWTDFYTKYGFMQSYDAFSRFRTGEYPIIIADYTFANQLEALAPEIKGLWDFTSIPGTLRDNGEISHSVNSNGTCAVIFNKNESMKYKSWEFIKWFTSEKIQTEYASRTESIMGVTGRFDTANTEALKNLSWSHSQLERLMKQREELEEIPVIPSSYAVTRNIMNAFRDTVNNGKNPRDTLIWYNRDINQEIKRKLEHME